MNYQELHDAVEKREIVSAKTKDGKVYRLFHATNGLLCYFPPRRSRSGFKVGIDLFETFVSFSSKEEPVSTEDKIKKQYNTIAKYKRMAQKASFTNSFIEDCKKLPDFETWKKDLKNDNFGTPCEPRPKSLYELGITTGNKIDGRVVSLERIAKEYPGAIANLRKAIKEKTEGTILSRGRFAGYDISISTAKRETGEFFGYLSLEYKDCGNGYYYLLINDDNFIGYDVD